MSAGAGYSGTPLPKKLGLADGQRVLFIGLPPELGDLATCRHFAQMRLADWPDWPDWPDDASGYDLIHGFTTARAVLEANARPLMDAIARDGTIWISWPKKAARVPTDVTEDVIRAVVLPIGLVDIKVAAVSDVWSGLKLVIRRQMR